MKLLNDPEFCGRMFRACVVTAILCIIVALALAITGCTVTPKKFVDNTASFDGGQQNSGLVGFYTNAEATTFMVVTPRFRQRFDSIAQVYGTNFMPAVRPGDGFTPFTNGTYLLDLENLYRFNVLNRKRKAQ